jgi:dethiobiotin synthetase
MITVKYIKSFSLPLNGAIYICQENNIDQLEESIANKLISKGIAELSAVVVEEDKSKKQKKVETK